MAVYEHSYHSKADGHARVLTTALVVVVVLAALPSSNTDGDTYSMVETHITPNTARKFTKSNSGRDMQWGLGSISLVDGGGGHDSRDTALLLVIVRWVVIKRENGVFSPKRRSVDT